MKAFFYRVIQPNEVGYSMKNFKPNDLLCILSVPFFEVSNVSLMLRNTIVTVSHTHQKKKKKKIYNVLFSIT